MHKALVPINGSDNALCAVRHVINLVRDREPLEVHLLNVQPDLRGLVTSFIVHGTVRDYQLEEGQKALRAACELLNQFDVEYTKHILIGHAADVIAECAKELHCQKVIMSTRGFGISTNPRHFGEGRVPMTSNDIHHADTVKRHMRISS